MRFTYIIIPLLFFTLFIASCSSDETLRDIPDTSQNRASVTLNRLDKTLFTLDTEDELSGFLSVNTTYRDYFMGGLQIGQKGVHEILYPIIKHPSMDTVRGEIDQQFGDCSNLSREFEDAYSFLKYYYPENGNVTLNTCVSGLRKDIYVNKDLNDVYIGLDYFLGEGATYRPNNYQYINKRYRPEMVLPLTMQYISAKYNDIDPDDNTLLGQMIYFGKAFYFAKSMLPYTPDSLIIGYDKVEWEGSELHLKKIWGVFIERELLYSTSHMEIMRYINEAPSTPAIANNCPGRIGQYLGWKIVNRYMERNPEVTLQELMAETDAQKIFQKSKFKPGL